MQRFAFTAFFLALVLLLVASACVDEGGTNSLPSVDGGSACKSDTASIQATIFVRNCTDIGCHRSLEPAASLDLESPGLEGRVSNVIASDCPGEILVTPGKPDTSYLMHKLTDEQPTCGIRMPRLERGLLPSDLACVREWITKLPNTPVADASPPPPARFCILGENLCNGACVDFRSDAQNCGGCGMPCPGDKKFCSSGQCVATCPNGTTTCGTGCVDTQTSFRNCGACGKTCGQGKVCNGGTCGCGADVKYKAQIEDAIFVPSCATASCHGRASAPAGNLDLRSGMAYGDLVGKMSTCNSKQLVVTGDVPGSYLVDKLEAKSTICGAPMPKQGGIGAASVALIEAWICNGAKDN